LQLNKIASILISNHPIPTKIIFTDEILRKALARYEQSYPCKPPPIIPAFYGHLHGHTLLAD
jgi:hypothetical protein